MATKNVGTVTINLTAGTVQFKAAMQQAQQALTQVGTTAQKTAAHTVSANQAAAASIRVAMGGLNNNLRAVENFLTKTLGLGKVLQAFFPIAGVLASAGLVLKLGEEVHNFFKKVQEHFATTTGMFNDLNDGINLSNQAMQVANDKLENNIAKLEHRPENMLKLALDEATLSAMRLSEALNKDLEALTKVLNESKQGLGADLISGQAGTGDIEEEIKKFKLSIHGLTGPDLKAALDAEIKKFEEQWIAHASAAENRRQHTTIAPSAGGLAMGAPPEAQTNRLQALRAVAANLKAARAEIDLNEKNAALTVENEKAEANKRALSLEEKAIKDSYDRILEMEEKKGKMSAAQKAWFRSEELQEIIAYQKKTGKAFPELEHQVGQEVGTLMQTAFTHSDVLETEMKNTDKQQAEFWKTENKKAAEQMKKYFGEYKKATEPRPDIPQVEIIGGTKGELEAGSEGAQALARYMKLNEAGLQSREIQEQSIRAEQRNLAEMQKGGFLRKEIVQQEAKILDMQNRLNDSTKAENDLLEVQVNEARRVADARQKTLELQIEMKKAGEGTEAADKYRRTQIEELLRQGTLKDGWDAFWLEQQQQAEKPGQILYKGMNQALDGVAKNLADLGSGQKGNWGKTFQDIGRQMQEATIKSTLHQGLGALSRRFGIGGVTRDGQSRSGAIFVDIVGPNGTTTATTPSSGGGGRGGGGLGTIFGGGSSTNPFIFNYASSAGSAYPGAAAIPARRDPSRTTETKGGDVTNIGPISVDARGADENSIYNRVFQAITAAVGIAVSRSAAAGAERAQRVPQ